ncbi:hypothetical protein [Szabonella alba]|uniref:N-acetyltransferase domain-containing protein n=1 Tax=Szabonella alba TaxID=2804194 RepID=A0A8K0VCM8_9RHOB|nr:hypothetical protein [Szabonella alba]MBL4917420.1 hypothetical protein [Szabonella alba]
MADTSLTDPDTPAADRLAIRPLASCLAAEWHGLRADLLPQEDPAVAAATLKRLVSQNGSDAAMLVLRGYRPVGLACYRITRGRDALDSVFEVTEWLFRPEASGTGAGAHLIGFLYMAAEAQGAPLVYWPSAVTGFRPAADATGPDRKAA